MKPLVKANIYLVLVTVMWGLTFPLIREAVSYIHASTFVFIRFGLAAICFLPFAYANFRKSSKALLIAGLALGVLNSGIYIFQTTGLETISASRSAFITGSNVLFVPFLLPLFQLGRPRKIDIISALICLLGLYILTGSNLHGISRGDLWTLASALCYAVSVVFVQWVSPRLKGYSLLTFYQILFAVPIAAIISAGNGFSGIFHIKVLIAVLFCSIVATIIGLYLQMKYQQYTTATRAALIFSLEPVFASIFAYFINGDPITSHMLLGGGVVLLSIIIPVLAR